MAGTFSYSVVVGTVLTAGPHTLSVRFLPTDSTDYTSSTATVTLTVNKATPAITWPTPAAISYGTELSADQLDATSPVAGTFVYTPAAGALLKAGSQTLSVKFTPTDTTDYTTAAAKVTLVVNAVPIVKLSATSLSFGKEAVGTASASQSVSLTNTGDTALAISSIAVTGADAASFAFVNNCGMSLAANATCAIHGHFAPTFLGALTAAITITDNASGSPQSIALSGTGEEAITSLSVTSLSFSAQTVGTASASQSVTLTNIGNEALTITSIAVTGTDTSSFDFVNNCGTSLAAKASCTIHGHFAPTAVGAFTAEITIEDNAAGSPQSIALSGTGQ